MSTNVKLEELVSVQVSSVGIILALVTAAMSQPTLDRAAFIAHVEDNMENMRKKGIDDALLNTLRVTLAPFKVQ